MQKYNEKIAKKFFYRKGYKLFDKKEDIEDYVQQCFFVLYSLPEEKRNVQLIAKTAAKDIFHLHYGMIRGKRYEFLPSDVSKFNSESEETGLASVMELGIAGNPNDRIGNAKFKVMFNDTPMYFDEYDIAELTGMKPQSVRQTKNSGHDLKVYVTEYAVYPSISAAAKSLKCRASNAKAKTREIVLKWGKLNISPQGVFSA